MKPINNYEKYQAFNNKPTQLPVGGYVFKISAVRYEQGQNGSSDRIVVAFDVAEGEFAGFFKKKFDADQNEDKKWKGTATVYIPKEDGSEQDTWTIQKMRTFTNALEDSNPNYKFDWDENKWKGLMIGGVFGEIYTMINGKQIKYHAFRAAYSVGDIHAGRFRIPKPQYKNGATPGGAAANNPQADSEGFMNISSDNLEDVPF